MVDKNDTLLREVEEELARERWQRIWDTYGLYILGAAALIVAAVGGYQIWHSRQISLAQQGGAQYEAALQLEASGKRDEAGTALQSIVNSGHAGYATLAALQVAAQDLRAGKRVEALAAFEKIQNDTSADMLLRDFARLQAASLRLGEADFTEIKNRLNDLANGTTAWRFLARELIGTAAYNAGQYDEARTLLTSLISEPGSPPGSVERARVILSQIAVTELGKAAAAAPAAAPTAPAEEPKAAPEPAASPAPAAQAK